MEVSTMLSASTFSLIKSAAGPRLASSGPTPAGLSCSHLQPRLPCASPSLSSSSLPSFIGVTARNKLQLLACEEEEDTAISQSSHEGELCTKSVFGILTSDYKTLLALSLALGFALGTAESAMALGPEGPLVEEFWENMRRYGLYSLTVLTGGLYSLLQPIFALLRNPITAILTISILSGSFYLLYLLLNTMLGIIPFEYKYA